MVITMGNTYRKYTWNITCGKCGHTWRQETPYFRFDGVAKERRCPQCGYKFFHREDYPYVETDDNVVINIDDSEGL